MPTPMRTEDALGFGERRPAVCAEVEIVADGVREVVGVEVPC
jgi:hypothetical protein